jgi:large subunit ribosomal protein L24
MLKIKVGDKVKILSGKDKGREGEVEKIFPKKGTAVIPGINIYKKHTKGYQGQKGGIYEIPRPIAVSRVALVCPKCKKASRVGLRLSGKDKIRFCKKCRREIDVK